jgi:hypothetical protein
MPSLTTRASGPHPARTGPGRSSLLRVGQTMPGPAWPRWWCPPHGRRNQACPCARRPTRRSGSAPGWRYRMSSTVPARHLARCRAISRYWVSVMKKVTRMVSTWDTVFRMTGLGSRPTKSPTLAWDLPMMPSIGRVNFSVAQFNLRLPARVALAASREEMPRFIGGHGLVQVALG